MSRTSQGIFIAAILAFFAVKFGVGALFIAASFMIIGAILGRSAEGKLDLRGVGRTLMGDSSTTSD